MNDAAGPAAKCPSCGREAGRPVSSRVPAGAVVTEDVPAGAKVYGVPARAKVAA